MAWLGSLLKIEIKGSASLSSYLQSLGGDLRLCSYLLLLEITSLLLYDSGSNFFAGYGLGVDINS